MPDRLQALQVQSSGTPPKGPPMRLRLLAISLILLGASILGPSSHADDSDPVPGHTASEPVSDDGISLDATYSVFASSAIPLGIESASAVSYTMGSPDSGLTVQVPTPQVGAGTFTNTTTGATIDAGVNTRDSGYECVVDTKRGSNFRAHRPFHYDLSTDNWEVHTIFHIYSLTKARYLTGVGYTTQWESCTIGAARNKKALRRMAAYTQTVCINNSANKLIGRKWGSSVDSGTIQASLGLEVATGPVKINGALPVTNGGKFGGSNGEDDLISGCPNSGNQVNGTWTMDYPGFGTRDPKGNVSHALYEFAGDRKSVTWRIGARAIRRY